MTSCKRCGRTLSNPKSIARQFGLMCYNRLFGVERLSRRGVLVEEMSRQMNVSDWFAQPEKPEE
jgi:hypothetical protein